VDDGIRGLIQLIGGPRDGEILDCPFIAGLRGISFPVAEAPRPLLLMLDAVQSDSSPKGVIKCAWYEWDGSFTAGDEARRQRRFLYRRKPL